MNNYKNIAIAVLFFIVIVLANAVGNVLDRSAATERKLTAQLEEQELLMQEITEEYEASRLLKDLL